MEISVQSEVCSEVTRWLTRRRQCKGYRAFLLSSPGCLLLSCVLVTNVSLSRLRDQGEGEELPHLLGGVLSPGWCIRERTGHPGRHPFGSHFPRAPVLQAGFPRGPRSGHAEMRMHRLCPLGAQVGGNYITGQLSLWAICFP